MLSFTVEQCPSKYFISLCVCVVCSQSLYINILRALILALVK